MMEPDQLNKPLWKDDFEPQQAYFRFPGLFKFMSIFFFIYIIVSGFAIFYIIDPIFAWFMLAAYLIMIGAGFLRRKRVKLEIQNIVDIQRRAYDLTGASLLGSAVHVAGYPKLSRDQNIVLALIGPNLAFYSYESDQPISLIPLQQIFSVQTVVYDEDRIPHIEVIDSSAQALQLNLNYEGHEISCLFRSMKKVRPIDWYHEIQKARIQGNDIAG